MKVFHLIDSLEVGGAEESLIANLPVLRDLGCRNTVGYLRGPGTLAAKIDDATEVVRLGGRGGHAGQAYRLAREIRAHRPDVLHTSLFWSDQIGRVVGRLLRVPVVCSLVNTSYEPVRLADNPHLSSSKLKIVQTVDSCTARLAAHFTAISEAVAESNARRLRIPRDKISIVYRARQADAFAMEPEDARNALIAELGLRPDSLILLNVARLIDQKGQRYLIEAMPQVLAGFPTAVLLIAGEGWLRPRLEEHIEKLQLGGSVRLLGNRDDVPTLLAAADLFLFPSLFEGLGGAVIEAMLAGKAVVASDIPVLRETLGYLHPRLFAAPADSAAWAAAIRETLASPELLVSMGEANRAFALEQYSLIENARKQFEVYGRVSKQAGGER